MGRCAICIFMYCYRNHVRTLSYWSKVRVQLWWQLLLEMNVCIITIDNDWNATCIFHMSIGSHRHFETIIYKSYFWWMSFWAATLWFQVAIAIIQNKPLFGWASCHIWPLWHNILWWPANTTWLYSELPTVWTYSSSAKISTQEECLCNMTEIYSNNSFYIYSQACLWCIETPVLHGHSG